MRQTLRPYQSAARDELRLAIARLRAAGKPQRALLVSPTGSGKTTIAAAIIEGAVERGGDVLFLAHRKELIDQCSARLDGAGIDHGIQMASHPRAAPWSRVQVASVPTLTRRLDRLPPATLIIVDECFPAGTLVDGRPIESIAVGDVVSCYDHARESITGRRVTHLFRSRPSELLTIYLTDNRRITCTPNHPLFTPAGYRPAAQLRNGDLIAEQNIQTKDMRGLRDELRPAFMEQPLDAYLLACMQEGAPRGPEEASDAGVPHLHGTGAVRGEGLAPLCTSRPGVLLDGMQEGMAPSGIVANRGGDESPVRLRENDLAQSDASPGDASEAVRDAPRHRASAACTDGQWSRADGAAGSTRGAAGLADGVAGLDRQAARLGLSVGVQGGHWECGVEDRGGDRRPQSSRADAQGGGREAGRSLAWARVDRIEIQERGGDGRFGGLCPDGLVYNLEVEEHHNYFVDGFLAHNCHHARATTYTHILDRYPGVPVIGLTATPWRQDNRGLGELFEDLVIAARPHELIQQGHLVPYTGFAYDVPQLDKVKRTGGDYQNDGLALVMSNSQLAGNIVEQWQRHCAGKRTVLFAVNVAHSLALVARFQAAGVAAEHVDGTTPKDEREGVLRRLARGETTVVCNVNVLTEGWDCPEVEVVILARPTLSVGLYMQMIGRGLRPSPGKLICRIHDHAGNILRHGVPDLDRDYSLKSDNRKPPSLAPADALRRCTQCFALFAADLANCPQCGLAPVPRPRVIKEQDGVAIPIEQLADESARRKRYLDEQLLLAESTGRKRGWAAYRYKEKFGEWPPQHFWSGGMARKIDGERIKKLNERLHAHLGGMRS